MVAKIAKITFNSPESISKNALKTANQPVKFCILFDFQQKSVYAFIEHVKTKIIILMYKTCKKLFKKGCFRQHRRSDFIL